MKTDSATIRRRYDRIAPIFDRLEGAMERMAMAGFRQRLWEKAGGASMLELGVGTGKNFPYHPTGATVDAIDFSPAMLAQARNKLATSRADVRLHEMDAERLAFPDDQFDTVIASFVFCSVPDPVQGLSEALRVCKPGGRLLLLEHVLSDRPWLARIMRWLNPLVVRLVGANIDRRTVENVAAAGWTLERVEDLAPAGLVKLIEARKPA